MTSKRSTGQPREVVGGVDTHLDTHTVAAIDTVGRGLGHAQFPATAAGYRQLLAWLRGLGTVVVVGVEGTGCYGAALATYLTTAEVATVEVDRPDRRTRRRRGKSDPVDAEAAARAALAQVRTGVPKDRTGAVEALRNLRIARSSGRDHRTSCGHRIKSAIVTAPEPLRAALRGLSGAALIGTCAALRPDTDRIGEPEQAVKVLLRNLARRYLALSEEIAELDALIAPLVATTAPGLLELTGVGPDSAGQILITAGQNAQRLRSEGAFAMLCGVAPLPASSGRTDRHRLNRGGNRQANAAIHRIVICRMRHDPRTRAYITRRTSEGLSKKDAIRCLKRLVARELYYALCPATKTEQPAAAA